MKSYIDLQILQQIYFFLMEDPDVCKLTDFDKSLEFFRRLHSGEASNFNVKVNQVIGKFGDKTSIILVSNPEFSDTTRFLNWVYETIKE